MQSLILKIMVHIDTPNLLMSIRIIIQIIQIQPMNTNGDPIQHIPITMTLTVDHMEIIKHNIITEQRIKSCNIMKSYDMDRITDLKMNKNGMNYHEILVTLRIGEVVGVIL